MCQQHKYCISKTNFIAFGHFPSIYNAKFVHFRPILTIIYYCFRRIFAILSFAFRYVTFEPFISGSSSTPHFEAERQLYNISKDKNWDFSNLWTPPMALNVKIEHIWPFQTQFWANFDLYLYIKFIKICENCVYVFGHNF